MIGSVLPLSLVVGMMGSAGAQVLMVLTSNDKLGDTDQQTGWYLPEAAHPFKVFKDAGVDMVWASPKGGRAPVDEGSVDAYKEDQESVDFMDENVWKETTPLKDIKPEDFKAVFVVGGYGVMWDLVEDKDLQDIAASIYEAGGIVSGVCHGPAALVGVKLSDGTPLVKDKEVACFSNEEEDALQRRDKVPKTCEDAFGDAGAKYTAGKAWTDHTAVSGRLITGQNPMSAKSTAEAVVTAMDEQVKLWNLPKNLLQGQGMATTVAFAFSGAVVLLVLAKVGMRATRSRRQAAQDEELLDEETADESLD